MRHILKVLVLLIILLIGLISGIHLSNYNSDITVIEYKYKDNIYLIFEHGRCIDVIIAPDSIK